MSSVITISQPPSIPGEKRIHETPTEMTFTPMDPEVYVEGLEIVPDTEAVKCDSTQSSDTEDSESRSPRTRARNNSLAKLENSISTSSVTLQSPDSTASFVKKQAKATVKRRPNRISDAVIAVVVLKEERVCIHLHRILLCLTSLRPVHSTIF
jgi:hypothetical protein